MVVTLETYVSTRWNDWKVRKAQLVVRGDTCTSRTPSTRPAPSGKRGAYFGVPSEVRREAQREATDWIDQNAAPSLATPFCVSLRIAAHRGAFRLAAAKPSNALESAGESQLCACGSSAPGGICES